MRARAETVPLVTRPHPGNAAEPRSPGPRSWSSCRRRSRCACGGSRVVARDDAQGHQLAVGGRRRPPGWWRGSRRSGGPGSGGGRWRHGTPRGPPRRPSIETISSPGLSTPAAGGWSPSLATLFVGSTWPRSRQDPQDQERHEDVHRRPGGDHDDPLPHQLAVVGAGLDLGIELLVEVHPDDSHVAAEDRPDAVLGLRLTLNSSGGKNSAKRSTRMPTALAALKWPNSCRMISAAKPTKVRTQLTVGRSPARPRPLDACRSASATASRTSARVPRPGGRARAR